MTIFFWTPRGSVVFIWNKRKLFYHVIMHRGGGDVQIIGIYLFGKYYAFGPIKTSNLILRFRII